MVSYMMIRNKKWLICMINWRNLTLSRYYDVIKEQTNQNFPLSTSKIYEIYLDIAIYVLITKTSVYFVFSHGYDVIIKQTKKKYYINLSTSK